ncbi:DNA mismatch endonuclease Vsr [Pseudidiomarina gelatinasegens]|uniref:Very short patch repair endonuclease n=1 Tax=Pseudidiomarina gelatinasegens TaxID=2487740 RepID=A0A443YVH4_9GAMM|nr:DNA mismatch endonuclease Vsr [Pseudidiomarina gelatinasegens]RWU07966.1 DNA mismatch endonuclease Vsr [Pseudidiomarina gelatinasegens]
MVDIHDKKTRSRNMSAIKSTDSKPEKLLRKALFAKGYRFRKNVKTLPGTPDIVLAKYRTCILVHGCFWHMHENCHLFKLPSTRKEFWKAKLLENRSRDMTAQSELLAQGWKVIIVWECSLKGKNKLSLLDVTERLEEFLTVPRVHARALEIR